MTWIVTKWLNFLQELFTREFPYSRLKHWIHVAQYILKAPPGRPGGDLCCHRMTDDWWAICSDCWARDPLLRPSMSCVLGRVEGTKVGVHATSIYFFIQLLLGHLKSNPWAQRAVRKCNFTWYKS